MMSAAIDTCERLEQSGYGESDLAATADVNGTAVSISDVLESALTYPGLVIASQAFRASETTSDPAVGNAERLIIMAMARAAANLVGEGQPSPEAKREVLSMLQWFEGHAMETVHRALAAKRDSRT